MDLSPKAGYTGDKGGLLFNDTVDIMSAHDIAIRAQRKGGEIAPNYPQPVSRSRWMGLGADLDGNEKNFPNRDSIPDHPTRNDYATSTAK